MDEKVADLVSVSMNSVSMTVQRIPENNNKEEEKGEEGEEKPETPRIHTT